MDHIVGTLDKKTISSKNFSKLDSSFFGKSFFKIISTYPILHEFGSPQNWEFRKILEIPMTGPYHKIGSFLFFPDQYFFKKTIVS